MTQVTTSFEKFTSVSQAGSLGAWSNLANLEQGSSGRAVFNTTGSDSNDVYFKIPNNFVNIPEGASFVSLRFQYTGELAGSAGATGRYALDLNTGSWPGLAFTPTVNAGDFTIVTPTYNRAQLGLTAFTPAEIVTKLKDGTLYFRLEIDGVNNVILAAAFYLENVRLEMTYTVPIGRGGAIIAATV